MSVKRAAWVDASLFGGAAVFYSALATDTVQGGDSGELTAVAATLGVAHPPGYPLFTLVGHVAAQIPVGTVAWRVALVSALAAAWTLLAVSRALRLLGVSWVASSLAIVAIGLAPTFVFLAGVAEVFTLNTAVAATLVWMAASFARPVAIDESTPRRPRRIGAWGFLLGLVVGLGGANHHTIILAFPIAIMALVALFRSHERKRIVAAAVLAGLALGLTPYAYLVLAGGGAGLPRWGQTETLEGFVRHVLRSDYGTFALGLLRGSDSAWDHVAQHLSRVVFGLGAAVLALAILGAALAVRGVGGPRRSWLGRATFAAWLLSGPIFHALLNIPIGDFGDDISARFDLLPQLFLIVLAAFGLDWALRALASNARLRFSRGALCVGLGVTLALQAGLGVPSAIPRRHTIAESFGRDSLAHLPANALLFIDGDRDHSVFTYLQEVAHVRRDVRLIHVALLGHRWFVEELRRREPTLNVPFVPGRALSREIMVSAHAAGRRVFVTQDVARQMTRADRLVPFGVVAELLAPGIAPPRPEELEAHQRDVASRVQARPSQTAPLRASDAEIPAMYLSGYQQLRAAYAHRNDEAGVNRCDVAVAAIRARLSRP